MTDEDSGNTSWLYASKMINAFNDFVALWLEFFPFFFFKHSKVIWIVTSLMHSDRIKRIRRSTDMWVSFWIYSHVSKVRIDSFYLILKIRKSFYCLMVPKIVNLSQQINMNIHICTNSWYIQTNAVDRCGHDLTLCYKLQSY